MKLEHIKKLLKAAEAKKQIERMQLAGLRAAKRTLDRQAEGLRETALRSRLVDDDDLAGVDLANYGRHFDRLHASAREKTVRAADFDAPIGEQEMVVRSALRQEIAWRNLSDAAEAARRLEKEKREEQTREETTRGK